MRFLLQFRGLHNHLRLAELTAALSAIRNTPESLLNANVHAALKHASRVNSLHAPTSGDAGAVLYGEIFFYADLRSEAEAIMLAHRTVLLRAIYVPIGHGYGYDSCISSIDKAPFQDALIPLRDEDSKPSFRCYVDAFGKSLSVDDQLQKIHKFSDVLRTFPGRVRMRDPNFELWILEDDFPRRGHGRRGAEGPRQIFLARKVASGQGYVTAKYSLKARKYIGPTSMDAELAFVMTNMAGVKEGHLVNDPFCGTGGVLVACAARGAICVGSDINFLCLKGKGGDQTILSNFHQYGLTEPIGILRADVMNSPIRHKRGGWFDAVVCDPPYGIKEGTRVFREDAIDAGLEGNHYQGTERIRFVDFLRGVLQYAVDVLVPGGRLVYWLPTTVHYKDEDVPEHPALRLIHNNEQPLTNRMSRRLITMCRLSDGEAEANERQLFEQRLQESREGKRGITEPSPAHYDLARKMMRQPERAENRLPNRNEVSK